MKISDINKKLECTPLIIRGNIESLLCLDSSVKIISGKKLLNILDSRSFFLNKEPTVVNSSYEKLESRFPKVSIKEEYWQLNPNDYLFDRFEFAKEIFLRQSEIKKEIVKKARNTDLIIFIIIDGLSYDDIKSWGNVKPCLVDTLTTTACGFKNIIGHGNPIIYDLYKRGFRSFYGYSYWDIDGTNELNSFIFNKISPSRFLKVQSFNEILDNFPVNINSGTYIQIVMQGLDGIAHKNRDEPLISAIVNRLFENVQKLADLSAKTNLRTKIFLTSDHGILWKHKSELRKIPSHSYHNHYHTRYYDSSVLVSDCHPFSVDGKAYSSLNYPFILRELRSNEWGVHGGVSVEESITPFYSLEIR